MPDAARRDQVRLRIGGDLQAENWSISKGLLLYMLDRGKNGVQSGSNGMCKGTGA